MKNTHTLFLASNSRSRQMLLKEAHIPYMVIGHQAREEDIPLEGSLESVVLEIARHKMAHTVIPGAFTEGTVIYVLTADSLGQDAEGVFHGKAVDREDAIAKIKNLSKQTKTATGFCLHKKIYKDGQFVTEKSVEKAVMSTYTFTIPDSWIDRYLEHSWAMIASGAIAIELYGGQFLQSIQGSYSTIVGLPLFELREALEELDFYN